MFRVGEVDIRGLQRFDNLLAGLGREGDKAVARAVSRAGDMGRTQVIKTLAAQTGLTQKVIRRSLRVRRASWDVPEYVLISAGTDEPLKYFRKRETKDGVEAYLGKARGTEWFAESFYRGGLFPQRRVDLPTMNGHVFVRAGGRTQLEKVTSGVFIPEEMVQGTTAAVWSKTVTAALPKRLDHEFNRLLNGAA
ncbi:phage tail protein [Pseudooceanicola sp. CBS1P-1]|uniref:Uncharacterized protein n=1 Tax=Pseudooceanicola albus TaxID=2692189 RepID=A0A6L7G1B3_9RHOB|nr:MULTISPECIES: hypothetical protein [Pseudooceanicola]MBT9383314.1 phage tail protein [Pseudooceanicola endophyticus]MXN16363.1 hypothetical protein [Pseudooceanicola albus]